MTARCRAPNLGVARADTAHPVPLDQVVVCAGEGVRSTPRAAKPTAGAGPASIGPEQEERRDAGAPRAPITPEFCPSPPPEQPRGETAARDRRHPGSTLGLAPAGASQHPHHQHQADLIFVAAVVIKHPGFSWEPPVTEAHNLTRRVFEHRCWKPQIFPARGR